MIKVEISMDREASWHKTQLVDPFPRRHAYISFHSFPALREPFPHVSIVSIAIAQTRSIARYATVNVKCLAFLFVFFFRYTSLLTTAR